MTLLRGKPRKRDVGPPSEPLIRYEHDSYGWALQQAGFLRAGRSEALDFINLADEIADVAGREYDKLESALSRVIQHLLKWDYQPERCSRNWLLAIRGNRRRIVRLLARHPGLKSTLAMAIADAFEDARDRALDETDLPEAALPQSCPYAWDDIMERELLWPETGAAG